MSGISSFLLWYSEISSSFMTDFLLILDFMLVCLLLGLSFVRRFYFYASYPLLNMYNANIK